MTKFRFPELRACPQFWKTGQPSSPTEDQCYFFMMQFSKIEGMPSIPEIWPASHPVQRKVLFWGGKTQKKSAKFCLQLPDTYKKYILQKKWSKTVIPALSSGQHNLQTLIGGCHHQLDVSSSGRPTKYAQTPGAQHSRWLITKTAPQISKTVPNP